MLINCVKVVKKSAQKMFTLIVDKTKDVDYFSRFHTINIVFQSFRQLVSTYKNEVSNLKNSSFTLFPQTSTITTNIYIENF
jgi:hypothetical protein